MTSAAAGRLAVGALGIIVLSSAASAAVGIRLALMPLPRSALGSGAKGLVRAADSGVVSNEYAAEAAADGVTAVELATLGRISGYTVDYRLPSPAVARPHELFGVQTIAELYRSPKATEQGLAFWRRLTRRRAGFHHGANVSVSPFTARVGNDSFAFQLSYRDAGRPFEYVGDLVFRSGRLIGAVFVSATDATGLRTRTVELAHKLADRIGGVLAGRIRR